MAAIYDFYLCLKALKEYILQFGFHLNTIAQHIFLACRSRQASIVLERYFRFEVSLLSFYACERDGPILVSGGSDIIT